MTKDIPNRAYSFISLKPNVWNPVENEIIEVYIIKNTIPFFFLLVLLFHLNLDLPHLYTYHAVKCNTWLVAES